ncbi:substrate-binding periplasmic protein [Pseudoduganella sp. OTU4001]|uniref:substrate-binding periplasmic protein n=1 Tax=Pseudoduganella sp. OTU4001 TaxID=3043854 RepID=UPI00313CE8DE
MPVLIPIVFLLSLALFSAQAVAAPVIAYNTYLYPPFRNADGSGLAHDLVMLLNQRMGGEQFKLVHVPRARLLMHLDHPVQRFNGIAIFLNPAFVGRQRAALFNWSEPLFSDRNVLVFRGAPVSAGELAAGKKGRRFGGVRGNHYQLWDPLVLRGQLQRDDGADEWGNVRKLEAGRIDFTQMNALTFEAMQAQAPELAYLTAVPEPSDSNRRCILISQSLSAPMAERLSRIVSELPADPAWQALMQRYGLHPPGKSQATSKEALRQARRS